MLRHIALLILLSIIAIFLLHEIGLLLNILVYLHSLISHFLSGIFSNSAVGKLFSHAISLMLAPIIITALPGFIYWLLTRRELNYVYLIAWIVWIMLVTCLAFHK